jgi:hypothetical protein
VTEEIVKTLTLLAQPGQVVELRAIGEVVASGYYTDLSLAIYNLLNA